MNKKKVTKKSMVNRFGEKLISVGYADLQSLLKFENEIAYHAGVYGWNCDYFIIGGGYCVATGYRPHGQKIDFSIVQQYEKEAREILKTNDNIEAKKEKMDSLINDFIDAIEKHLQ